MKVHLQKEDDSSRYPRAVCGYTPRWYPRFKQVVAENDKVDCSKCLKKLKETKTKAILNGEK